MTRNRLISLVLALSLLWSPAAWAVSNQFMVRGTPVVFADTGGNAVLAFSATGAGAGKYSDRYDMGTGATPATWIWNCQISLTGTNVAGSFIEIYVAWSDGTNADGAIGTTNASLATDKRRNLKRVGTVVTDQVTTNVVMTGSGQAFIPTRYFSVAFWNATGIPLQTSTTLHKCTFTPSYWQMQ